jgi:hypothetical protein
MLKVSLGMISGILTLHSTLPSVYLNYISASIRSGFEANETRFPKSGATLAAPLTAAKTDVSLSGITENVRVVARPG